MPVLEMPDPEHTKRTSLFQSQRYTYLLAVLSMVFWGMSFVWTTIALRQYNPVTIIFLRLIISTLLLFSILLATRKLQRISASDRKLIFLSALLNPFFYFIGENYGVKLSTPTIAAVVIATIPVFTPFFAFLFLRERMTLRNWAGIIISFAGIGMMLFNRDFSFASSPAGLGLLLFAVLSAIMYSVLLKKLTERYSPVNIIAWQNLIGILLFLPLFLFMELKSFLSFKPGAEVFWAIIQLAVFASSLAFIFFTATVKSIGVNRANIFSNLIPVFTAIFSFIFIGEMFTLNKLAGMVVVISGVFVAQKKRRILQKTAK